MGDADMFCANKLLLTDKPLRKTQSLLSQYQPRNPVLPLMLKSWMYIDYCWLRNRWRKLGPSDPKNHPRSPVLWLTLTSSAQINYSWQTNRWGKLSPCSPKYQPRNPVIQLTLKSSIYTEYCCLRNRWRKLGPSDPKIIQEAQIYGWRWHLQRT